MKQNNVRLMVLGVLIMLCVWQTTVLWLGDMSGHIFLSDSIENYEMSYVHPKQVWCNVQGNIKGSIKDIANSGIYRLESNVEKEDLMNELIKEIEKGNLMVETSPKEKYADLLNGSQGIIYEFGTELTIEEIMGKSLFTSKNKYEAVKIKEIYLDLSESKAYKSHLYLIDEQANIRQKITLNSQLKAGIEMVNLYADKENIVDQQIYQASINSTNERDFFIGNTFYPQVGSEIFIQGQEFKFKPIIKDLEGKELENYVNSLFKNPSYKTSHLIETGIAFSDNLNVSVKYNTIGTLEFQKTLVNEHQKLSSIERMNKINTFIKESGAIPDFLKKGLYLENIHENKQTDEIIYQFGYRYKDSKIIVLSDKAKEQLGLNAFLELGIKNGEITSGKWIMLEIDEVGDPIDVTRGSTEAINEIYENSGLTELEQFKLESLECGYLIEDVWLNSRFVWIGSYKGQFISTIEKTDNE